MSHSDKRALLVFINLLLIGGLYTAYYYGKVSEVWDADVLKLSFVVVPLFLLTGFALAFDLIGPDMAENIEGRLPMIALCGTVYGIIVVFEVLGRAKFGGASDFKSLIGPLLGGGGSAMWPTFLALAGSNLLWVQLLIKRA